MKKRINVRVVTYDPDKQSILLVRNRNDNFWYPPGGGLEADEDLTECATREMLEETDLHVDLIRLLYAQELHEPKNDMAYIELFWLAKLSHEQEINKDHVDLDPQGSVGEAKWFTKADLQDLTIFPERLKNTFWDNVDKTVDEDPFIGVFK